MKQNEYGERKEWNKMNREKGKNEKKWKWRKERMKQNENGERKEWKKINMEKGKNEKNWIGRKEKI